MESVIASGRSNMIRQVATWLDLRAITTLLALSILPACTRSAARPAATADAESPSAAARWNAPATSRREQPVAGALAHALDLSVEPSTLSTLRASPRASANLLEPSTHEVWSGGRLRPGSSRDGVVLEDNRDDGARRLTLLCDGQQARVVAEIDARGLQPVTTESTFVRPERPSGSGDPLAPGLRLRAGERLDLRGEPKDGARRVVYAVAPLEVTGLVPDDHVDIAYTPGEALPATHAVGTPAVLRRTVDLLDAPNGRAFGTIEVGASNGEPQVRVVARSSGHALVLLDLAVAQAIGWVPEETLRNGSPGEGDDIWGGLLGEQGKTIRLAKGTVLLGPSNEQPVGVVKHEDDFACVQGCRGPQPMVSVEACGTDLKVRIGART